MCLQRASSVEVQNEWKTYSSISSYFEPVNAQTTNQRMFRPKKKCCGRSHSLQIKTSQQPTLASHFHHDIPRLIIIATNLTAAHPVYACLTWAHLTSVHLRIFQLYILHLHIWHLHILHLDPSHLRTLHLRFLHLRIFYLHILHHFFLIWTSCIFTSCIYPTSSVLTSVHILSLLCSLASFFFLSLSLLSLFSLFSFILTCSLLIGRV